jgi:hypothetical protein
MIYHGYENGFRTLGRQTLLEPIEWTDDGWFHGKGGTLSTPLAKPRGGGASAAGFALSDDFSSSRFGVQWSFFNPGPKEMERVRYQDGRLIIRGEGLQNPQRAWLALAMSSTLAGNFTVVGSVANLIVARGADVRGVTIGFWTYFKVGAPLTVLTLLLGVWWL